MLNSSVLDVAIGVIFGFLSISLVTSAIVEGINSVLKLRSSSLLTGIKSLVNDPQFVGLARELYQHAAVNPRGSGVSERGDSPKPLKNTPAYVDKLQFAAALLDVTGLSAASAAIAAQQPGPQAIAALQDAIAKQSNPQIEQLLKGIIQRTKGDIELVRHEIAEWFDGAMDRVGGAFKRWTQLASFIIALAIATTLNVDTVHLATLLWEQPVIVDQLKQFPNVLQATTPPSADQDAIAARLAREKAASEAVSFLERDLPVGWPPGRFLQAGEGENWQYFWLSTRGWIHLPGWVLTAIATLFGAPFWFDVLQGAVRLKGSGPSPAEKKNGRAASA